MENSNEFFFVLSFPATEFQLCSGTCESTVVVCSSLINLLRFKEISIVHAVLVADAGAAQHVSRSSCLFFPKTSLSDLIDNSV